MSNLLQLITKLKDNLSSNWHEELDKINVLDNVMPLYKQKWKMEQSNRILAFIVFAYDKDSGYIDIHKNRDENKIKIIEHLGGDIKNIVIQKVVKRQHAVANDIIAWLMEYMRDWKWDTVITLFEYHAEMMRLASKQTDDEFKEKFDMEEGQEEIVTTDISIEKIVSTNIKKKQLIQEGINARRDGEAMLKEIKREWMAVDFALKHEGLGVITDANKIESWEHYISSIRKPGK